MASFQQLPQYQSAPGIDFQPLNQGIQAFGNALEKRRVEDRNLQTTNALARGDYAGAKQSTSDPAMALHIGQAQQQKEQFDYTSRRQKIQDLGNMAVAADNEQDPTKRKMILDEILSHHPDSASLGPMYSDPVLGPRLLRAQAGKARDALDEQQKQAQIKLTNAHADYYTQAGAAKSAAPAPDQTPKPIWDLDENGRLTDRSQTTQYQGGYLNVGVGAAPPSPTRRPTDTALPAGGEPQRLQSPETAAERAKKEAEGIRDTLPGQASNKLKREADIQQVFTGIYGKPQPGMKWSENGSQIPIEGSKGNQTQTTLNSVLKVSKDGMDTAFKTLLDNQLGIAGRAAGKALDFGETGQAYADLNLSVRGAVYALSGKTVTNKEFEGFLDKFMPKYGDGATRIEMKRDRLKRFLTALETKSSKGVLTGEDAVFSAIADSTAGDAQPAAKPVDPAAARLKSKYGLE